MAQQGAQFHDVSGESPSQVSGKAFDESLPGQIFFGMDDAALKAPLILSEAEVYYLIGASHLGPVRSRSYLNGEDRVRANSNISDKSVPATQQENKSHQPIDLDLIRAGLETRTTITLRNLPRRMSEEELRGHLDLIVRGGYDYLYLPPDISRNKNNRGFAFMNATSPQAIASLVQGLQSLPEEVPLRSAVVAFTHFQGNKDSLEGYVKIRRTIRH